MAEVISLRGEKSTPSPDEPTIEGEAFCGACSHEWRQVAPVGETRFECPNCKRWWGNFKSPVVPDVAWRCRCGEQLFWLTATGAMCRNCGLRSNQWAD